MPLHNNITNRYWQNLDTVHPIETNRQDRSYNKKRKLEAEPIFNSGEDTLKTVHGTFQPGVPVILHLPALTDGSLNLKENTTPTLFVIQEGLNCLEMTDYFFTNIEPKPIIVERPPAHHSTSTSHQPLNEDKVPQQTHPQQPEETRIHPSMLINRQVPVLNLTDIKITSHADLQDAFNSLCVCSHGGKEDTQDQYTK